MLGTLVVGKGGELKPITLTATNPAEPKSFQGVGVVVATTPRAGRVIVNHEEIRGYMAAMEMSFSVASPSLLNGLNAGDRIQFTIDAVRSAITSIEVIEAAPSK